jgi:PEP-CTERM motif
MRHLVRTVALAFILFATCSIVARADPLIYDFVTSNTPDGIVTTSVPASPAPTSFTATSFEIIAPFIVDGDPMTLPVDFFTAAGGGGAAGGGMHFGGPLLFSGPTSAPSFLAGTFSFGDFTVAISPAPEPATVLLFGIGALTLYVLGRRALSRTDRADPDKVFHHVGVGKKS